MKSLSVEIPVGQYVKLQEVKDGNDFPDDLDDEELLVMIKEANQDIETKLKPVAASLPLADGTPNFKACSRAGLIYVRSLWKEKKHNFELSDKLESRYNKKMVDIIKAVKAEPIANPRTQTLLVSRDPRDAKLPAPTQYDNFVFDDFA